MRFTSFMLTLRKDSLIGSGEHNGDALASIPRRPQLAVVTG